MSREEADQALARLQAEEDDEISAALLELEHHPDDTEPIAVNVPVPVGAGDCIRIGACTTITLQDGEGQ